MDTKNNAIFEDNPTHKQIDTAVFDEMERLRQILENQSFRKAAIKKNMHKWCETAKSVATLAMKEFDADLAMLNYTYFLLGRLGQLACQDTRMQPTSSA